MTKKKLGKKIIETTTSRRTYSVVRNIFGDYWVGYSNRPTNGTDTFALFEDAVEKGRRLLENVWGTSLDDSELEDRISEWESENTCSDAEEIKPELFKFIVK
jgi:hypothetical protein